MIIPEKLFLSGYKKEIYEVYEKLKEKNDSDLITLALFLYKEIKKENSFYKYFINYLPTDFSCFPIFYTNEQKNILKNSQLEERIKIWEDQLANEHIMIKEEIGIDISLDEYKKCRHLSWSRDFNIHKDGISFGTMIPLADLFNFHPEKINVEWYQQDENFYIKSTRDLKVGEEIFVSYGDRSNLLYLLNYGFTIENNPNFIIYEREDLILPGCLELKDAVVKYRKSNKPLIINRKQEIQSLDKFRKTVTKILQNYPTTIEDDKNKYSRALEENNFNLINIYTYLIEEKELLFSYIRTITLFKNYFQNDHSIEKLSLIRNSKVSPLYCELVEYYLTNLK
jgi:hypothetical protein